MNKTILIEKLCYFTDSQLSSLAKTNPIISVCKPLLSRIVHNKVSAASNLLDLLADGEGNIDAETIIGETIDSVLNTQPFNINVPVLGNITIGNGNIKMGIPFTDKSIVFNETDFNELKEIIRNG